MPPGAAPGVINARAAVVNARAGVPPPRAAPAAPVPRYSHVAPPAVDARCRLQAAAVRVLGVGGELPVCWPAAMQPPLLREAQTRDGPPGSPRHGAAPPAAAPPRVWRAAAAAPARAAPPSARRPTSRRPPRPPPALVWALASPAAHGRLPSQPPRRPRRPPGRAHARAAARRARRAAAAAARRAPESPPPPTRLGGAPDRVHDAGRPAARARRVWPAAAAGAPAASGAAPPGQPRSPPPSRGCRAHAHPRQRAGPVRFGCAARVRCVVRSHAPPAHAAHACPPGVGTPLAGRWPVGSGRRGRRGGSRHRPQAGGWDHTRAARRRRQRHAPPADPPPRQHADSGGQGGRRHKPVASDAATAPIPRSPPCTRCTASGGRERRG